MAAAEALALFPGIESYIAFDFVLKPGFAPSTATFVIQPQILRPQRDDTLQLRWTGDRPFRLRFPGCRFDRVEVNKQRGGLEYWTCYIQDRRWKWQQTGRISGRYNVRDGEEEDATIREGTEKTPRELATLCLEAMGERSFDVSQLPNEPRPFVEWDYKLPSDALDELISPLGCYLVPVLNRGTFDRVRIERLGHGRELPGTPGNGRPPGDTVEAGGLTFNPPERPDALIACGRRTRVQMDLELEAVGKDFSDDFAPINDLSYAPATGNKPVGWAGAYPPAGPKELWQFSDPPYFQNVSDVRARDFAQAYVFRYYRIKTPFKLPFSTTLLQPRGEKQPETVTQIKELRDILPIEDAQLDLSLGGVGKRKGKDKRPLPAWVYGVWYDHQEIGTNVTGDNDPDPTKIRPIDPAADSETQKKDREKMKAAGWYDRQFSIDRERGIVIFSEPVYRKVDQGKTTEHILAAKLWLRVVFSLRDKVGGWLRYEKKRENTGPKYGTQPRYLVKEDVGLQITVEKTSATIANPSGGNRTKTNRKELDEALDRYLDIAATEYEWDTPCQLTYDGFELIQLDGAIREVHWWIDREGGHTSASRNTESLAVAPSLKEQQFLQRQSAKVQAQAADNRALRDVLKGLDKAARRWGS